MPFLPFKWGGCGVADGSFGCACQIYGRESATATIVAMGGRWTVNLEVFGLTRWADPGGLRS